MTLLDRWMGMWRLLWHSGKLEFLHLALLFMLPFLFNFRFF